MNTIKLWFLIDLFKFKFKIKEISRMDKNETLGDAYTSWKRR